MFGLNSQKRIALVAQAPGEVEDEEGNMFVGRSGSILNSLIESAGVERKNFYMTNLIKCFLPDYRRPKREETKRLAKRLKKYRDQLFTFVRSPPVKDTNNIAERALRPQVVKRKISGGHR
ncbi:MAG: uracil-DNA glycosylase family protein, partial [Candidatus Bipolaricaulota bacterium]